MIEAQSLERCLQTFRMFGFFCPKKQRMEGIVYLTYQLFYLFGCNRETLGRLLNPSRLLKTSLLLSADFLTLIR